MKINRQILSAILMIAVFAPAVRADLITDPKEFNLLKNLTGGKRKDRSVSPRPKYESVTGEKSNTKSSDKASGDNKSTGKIEAKAETKSKTDSSNTESKSDTKPGDKSSDNTAAKSK